MHTLTPHASKLCTVLYTSKLQYIRVIVTFIVFQKGIKKEKIIKKDKKVKKEKKTKKR